jgi:hypothetical protein
MSRTRNRNYHVDLTVDELTYTSDGWNNPNPGPLTVDAQVYEYNETMTDEVSPGYFSLVRNGGILPVNPMTQSKFVSLTYPKAMTEILTTFSNNNWARTRLTHNLGIQAMWEFWYAPSDCVNNMAVWNAFGSYSVPSVEACVVEAVARARTSSFDAGTFVAEFNKTVRMISQFKTNVFRRADSIVNARQSEIARKGLAAFSEFWLEARYGWRTLSYDINDIRDSINTLRDSYHSQYSRGYANYESSDMRTASFVGRRIKLQPFVPLNDFSYIDISYANTQTIHRRAGAFVETVLDDIGFIDPLVTSWEVIPFSFIVDWFINVGQNVNAFSPFAVGDLANVWSSDRSTVEWIWEGHAVETDSPGNYTQKISGPRSGTLTSVWESYSRSPQIAPSFHLEFQTKLDWQKLIDLAAIASLRYIGLLGKIRKLTRT